MRSRPRIFASILWFATLSSGLQMLRPFTICPRQHLARSLGVVADSKPTIGPVGSQPLTNPYHIDEVAPNANLWKTVHKHVDL